MADNPVLTNRSSEYLARIQESLSDSAPRMLVERVERLVRDHDGWRGRCLNMNAAETLMSRRSRRLLDSDMATRLTEGLPGDKLYPHGIQNEHIDQIEALIIALLRRQFGAQYVEWRPVSTTMANAAAFFALLEPGDTILAQAEDGGGNYSYHAHGPAGLARAKVVSVPAHGSTFEIDLEQVELLASQVQPRMIVVGGSNVLFPYPLQELRRIADRCGAKVLYDAAHVALLISHGDFQRPLEEGADIVTFSTAKSICGPVGGVLLTNDAEIARKVVALTFPGLLQTRDENKYSALAVALAEIAQFGRELAGLTVANARALAAALEGEGFKVLARERNYTQSYQIFLELGDQAQEFERRCQAANILVSDCALSGNFAWTRRTGARLATHELTRIGMNEAHMQQIAVLIRRVVRDREDPARIAAEVRELLDGFTRIAYSFD